MEPPFLLTARAISKRYPGTNQVAPVLAALDLNIMRGEVVVISGRSGSGKSTLLNLVGQMDAPSTGAISFEGVDTTHWSDEERTAFRCRKLGFVFQAYNLLPTLSVRENVQLPLELNETPDDDRVDRLLGHLGLKALGERYPDEISGGEQQRTAIARALIHRPALIIADEPTGNLDRETGRQVVDLFESSVRDAGAALLMATHSVDMIGRADRVFELQDGHLQELRP